MVTSLVKKKIIAGDDKGERSAPSMPLDYHYLTVLQLYGELVVVLAFGHFLCHPSALSKISLHGTNDERLSKVLLLL